MCAARSSCVTRRRRMARWHSRGRGGARALAGAEAIALVSPTITQPRFRYVLNDTVQNEGRAAYASATSAAGGRRTRWLAAARWCRSPSPITSRQSRQRCSASRSRMRSWATRAVRRRSTSRPSTPEPTRNVVASFRGTDPKLKNEYIVIGAHSDHIGMSPPTPVVEHDSLKAYNIVARVEGADSRGAHAADAGAVGADQRASRIRCARSIRRDWIQSATAPTTTARARSRFSKSPKRSRRARSSRSGR